LAQMTLAYQACLLFKQNLKSLILPLFTHFRRKSIHPHIDNRVLPCAPITGSIDSTESVCYKRNICCWGA
ncbi:MAG: hypothetical protein LBH38_00270, partial [Holosporales bacterium]|nr:hypothetical protein [Holosporales bacterium]